MPTDQQVEQGKRAEGFKLLTPHSDDCFCKDNPETAFVLPNGMTDRNKIGHRRGSWTWFRFRCNDGNCPAEMGVRWDVLARFVGTRGGTDAE